MRRPFSLSVVARSSCSPRQQLRLLSDLSSRGAQGPALLDLKPSHLNAPDYSNTYDKPQKFAWMSDPKAAQEKIQVELACSSISSAPANNDYKNKTSESVLCLVGS